MTTANTSLGNVLLSGFLTWLIPFLISVPLVGRDGQPRISVGLFKSVMIVAGAAVGAWLLVRLFRRRPTYRHPGLVVGSLWFAINIGFDLLVLVPLAGMSLRSYTTEIGIRYLIIPIMAIAIDLAGRPSTGAKGGETISYDIS